MTMNRLLCPLALLLLACLPTCAQTLAQELDPALAELSEQLVSHLHEQRPEWMHDAVPPATPPGSKPSSTVAIHFWRSSKCLTAEHDSAAGPRTVPVACNVKVAIYLFPTPADGRNYLKDIIGRERLSGPRPDALAVGDEGYVWGGNRVIFIKGRFLFWVDTNVQDNIPADARLSLDAPSLNITKAFAKDVAAAVPSS